MDMKKTIVLTLLSLCLAVGTLMAQNVSNSVRRDMNLALLESIGKLERVSALSGQEMVDEFVSMFRDPRQMVYNDLIGYSQDEMLPLNVYVEALMRSRM